jgi:flagellar protein FlbD
VICLTRLNGSRFYVNADHIQSVESSPDTHVLLTNGQSYVVAEPAEAVAELAVDYQRRVRCADWAALLPETDEPGVVAFRTPGTERGAWTRQP